ncbi:hypothetical protein KC318_g10 [Hortaea werneckii]|nr:hypothetical protein KC334_g10 [Hortaea werneckii]KAI7028350.1 hypothetical protein KC355_g11 [Hortaea werneckii]KAI7676786.1 hypothetical protein KC318_g10 [Hortaea werneckii]
MCGVNRLVVFAYMMDPASLCCNNTTKRPSCRIVAESAACVHAKSYPEGAKANHFNNASCKTIRLLHKAEVSSRSPIVMLEMV